MNQKTRIMSDFFNDLEELCEREDTVQTFMFRIRRIPEFRGLLLKRHTNFSGETLYDLYRIYYIGGEISTYPHVPSSFITENEEEAIKWAEGYFNEHFKFKQHGK